MPNFHPDTALLTDFSAGTLPESQALCVSTHLHYCQACRSKINELTQLGAILFEQPLADQEDDAENFSRLIGKIDSLDGDKQHAETTIPVSANSLPLALAKICKGELSRLKWKNQGTSLRTYLLRFFADHRQTALLFMKAGGSIPDHCHHADEYTVVIQGSFSDQDGTYLKGDFVVRQANETHRPVASQDEDCICLICMDAPIVMTQWFYRLVQPLFRL